MAESNGSTKKSSNCSSLNDIQVNLSTLTAATGGRLNSENIRSPKHIKESSKLSKEKLAKQKQVWRKESLEKRPRSGPLIAKHGVRTSNGQKTNNEATTEQRRRSLRPTSPTYESAFKRHVVNRPPSPSTKVSNAPSFRARRTNSPAIPSTEDALKRKIEKSKRAQLYLLQQAGPNSFIIGGGDGADQKHKVIVGPQSCTCGKGPHCVHILFVMNRVFLLTEQDVLMSAKVLKNFEVEGLFRKYEMRRKQRLNSIKNVSPQVDSDVSASSSSSDSSPSATVDISDCAASMELTCPICLLELLAEAKKTECENCHNTLHMNCMAIWYQLVSKQGEVLSCPLCRAVWPDSNKPVLDKEFDTAGADGADAFSGSPNDLGVSPVAFPDIEPSTLLPRSQPIPAEYKEMAEPWLIMFDEDLIGCLFTKSNWVIRETALRYLSREIVLKLSASTSPEPLNQSMESLLSNQSEDKVDQTNQYNTRRQSIIDKILEISCSILTMSISDPVYKVYVSTLRALRTMLSYCTLDDVTNLRSYMQPVIQSIILKCADGNRKTNQLSLSTLSEFAKDQEGELAIGKELNILDQPGLGGCLYVLECCILPQNSEAQNIQSINGRLLTINQLIDEYPSAITGLEDNPRAYKAVVDNTLLPIIEFAVKSLVKAGNQTRTLKLSKKIIINCSKLALRHHSYLQKICQLFTPLDMELRNKLKRKVFEMTVLVHGDSYLGQQKQILDEPKCSSPTVSDMTREREPSMCLPDDRRSRSQLGFGDLYSTSQVVEEEDDTPPDLEVLDEVPDRVVQFNPKLVTIHRQQIDSKSDSDSFSDWSSEETEEVEADNLSDKEDVPSMTSTQDLSLAFAKTVSLPDSEGNDSTIKEADDDTLTNLDVVDLLGHPKKCKLSRGKVLVGSKPVVMRSKSLDCEQVEADSIASCSTQAQENLDVVDGDPPLDDNGNLSVRHKINRDISMGFEPHPPGVLDPDTEDLENEFFEAGIQSLEFQTDTETNVSGSMSINLSSAEDSTDESLGDSMQQSRASAQKNVPFKKYRKHARSRTDPLKSDRLKRGQIDSPRYHSDPAADNSTSSSSTPRSPPTSSSSPSRASLADVHLHIRSPAAEDLVNIVKPLVRPMSAEVPNSVDSYGALPDRASSLKANKGGSRIPQIKLKPALKLDSRRPASMAEADISLHKPDTLKHESSRVSPPGSPRLSRTTVSHKKAASGKTESIQQGKTRQGSEDGSPPRPRREITLPLSPSQGRRTATVNPTPSLPQINFNGSTSGAKLKEKPTLQAAGVPSEVVKKEAQVPISQPSTSRQSSEAPVTFPEDEVSCDPLISLLSKNKLSGSISKNSISESNILSGLAVSTSGSSDEPRNESDSLLVDDLSDSAGASPYEKPVSFKSEVALFSPRESPSRGSCHCKDEVEREEAIALAKAMEVSSIQLDLPKVPGLSTRLQEETITIHVQQDQVDGKVGQVQYLENIHWKRGMMIGTGGFSTCYQCRDVKTGIIMAVKQISFARNSESEQNKICTTIVEEIKMMAGLDHPNIVRILGATQTGNHFNMFVEWMPGGSITHLLEMYGAFSEPVITSYSQQVLLGLAYLHEHGILHRDMKGANLLVDSTGKHLRIGDFGACARLASSRTGAGELQGQLLGTIAFMAPEVLRGEHYGRACDVWSVGCVIIEMCTTKPPWNASNVSNHLKLIFKIASANAAPPIPDNLSPPIKDLMLRCLEADSKDRPTAKDLLQHPLFTQYLSRNVQ